MLLGWWMVIASALLGGPAWHLLVRPCDQRKVNETLGADYVQYRSNVRCWLPARLAKPMKLDPR